jgi:hypothetical protein
LPPAYLIENTAFQHNWRSPEISSAHFHTVCAAIGQPVCIDAAQFDSYAHRLRNYWTNLCAPEHLLEAVFQVTRTPNLCVQDILQQGRYASPVLQDDHSPYYVCNRRGHPCLPYLPLWPFRSHTPSVRGDKVQ